MNIERIKKDIFVDGNGCWIWQKSKTGAGYGQLKEGKKYWTTHVYAFSCENFVPAKGQVVRHVCHVRACCNPNHLKIGSYSDNYQDSVVKYTEAAKKKRKIWIVGGVVYSTFREACKKTGLSSHSLVKFTSDGVFDIEAYRAACKIARWRPKI